MRVLFVTPYLPGPPVFGGQRRIHGLVAALSELHEVSIIALAGGSEDVTAGVEDAKRWCKDVVVVRDDKHKVDGAAKRLLQLRASISRRSYEAHLYARPAFQRALEAMLADHEYDVVNCEFVFMAGYRFRPKRARRPALALDEHNVEYDILKRTASAGSLDRRVFNTVNWPKLRREELAAWRLFDGVTLTSERDQGFVTRLAPGVRTRVVPNGVDVDSFKTAGRGAVRRRELLFFGALNYYPNTDAVEFLVREVMPHVVRRFPDVRLRIVGPGASSGLRALTSEHVEFVGFVDDLHAEIERAAVVLAPLRIGGGTRLKILEAMSMAKPIVATTIGAEGIDVTRDRDIVLADTPEELARGIGKLFDDEGRAEALGKSARLTAEAKYSWRAAARGLASFYEELVASGPE